MRAYRPGEWYGVLGANVIVLVPPSEKARVSHLWELVDEGADFAEMLDAVIAGGIRELPAFALVSLSGDETTVVLRGPATASFELTDGQRVEIDGSTVRTWVERRLSGVVRMEVRLEDVESGDELPIETGLVRLSRLTEPAGTDPAAARDDPYPMVELGETPDEADEGDEPAPEPDPDGTETFEPFPVPATAPDAETDELPHPAQAPAPTTRPVARLVFSAGDDIEVDRVILVGRAPEARRFTATEEPRLVTVASPHQEISSTHIEVRPGSGADHGSAVVTDLGSTNGTWLTAPGLAAEPLQPGVAVQLVLGSVVDLGDGVTIRVASP